MQHGTSAARNGCADQIDWQQARVEPHSGQSNPETA